MNISLSVYSVRLKKDGEFFFLDNIASGGVKKDFLQLTHDYIQDKTKELVQHSRKGEKVYSYNTLDLDVDKRILAGILDCGELGLSSKFHDITTKELTHTRTLNEAESMPFFFLLYVPKNKQRGLIIFEKISNRGPYIHLKHIFDKSILPYNNSLSVELSRYCQKDELYQILPEAIIKEFKFINNEIPSDIADINKINQDSGKLVTTIRSPSADLIIYILGKDYDKLRKGFEVAGGIEFYVGHSYENLSMQIDYKGKSKTVSITQEEFSIDEDITNKVKLDDNGHPTYETIKKIALEKLYEIINTDV